MNLFKRDVYQSLVITISILFITLNWVCPKMGVSTMIRVYFMENRPKMDEKTGGYAQMTKRTTTNLPMGLWWMSQLATFDDQVSLLGGAPPVS